MAIGFTWNAGAAAEIELRGQHAVENALEEIAQDARRYAPVETGELRASIHVQGNEVRAEADHAVYVEYGTRNMRAQPFMRPALYRKRNLRSDV